MTENWVNLQCPVASTPTGQIQLSHGEGGRQSRELISRSIIPHLTNPVLTALGDGAVLPRLEGRLAFSTDSFVVSPLFFPGGDIGSLAVYGTVNDLVVSGARPRWLSLALILEEGLPLATLERILSSIAQAARIAAVEVVTGDTKVLPRGTVDQIYINTSGLGEILEPPPPGPTALQEGDELVVSGPIGQHGVSILASREELGIEPVPLSDCAPLLPLVETLRAGACPITALRDATRGGIAAVLQEWAEQSRLSLSIDERSLPVSDPVRSVCELLGLDPLHIANEGTMLVAVPAGWGLRAVELLRQCDQGTGAACIGRVTRRRLAPVFVRRALGTDIPLDDPQGAPLPRIC